MTDGFNRAITRLYYVYTYMYRWVCGRRFSRARRYQQCWLAWAKLGLSQPLWPHSCSPSSFRRCVCVCVRARARAQGYMCVCVCVCVCVYVCMYVYIHIHIHIHIHMHAYVCVCVCVYVYIYICYMYYVYIYTHTHTFICITIPPIRGVIWLQALSPLVACMRPAAPSA
jgi:hypothetical protein